MIEMSRGARRYILSGGEVVCWLDVCLLVAAVWTHSHPRFSDHEHYVARGVPHHLMLLRLERVRMVKVSGNYYSCVWRIWRRHVGLELAFERAHLSQLCRIDDREPPQ